MKLKTSQSNPYPYFTILASHYPLICSQIDDHCTQTLITLTQALNEISLLNEVDLYLGAHMHQYERVAPYKNGTFSIGEEGPYGKGRMPSIVEGVAGNQIGIIDAQFSVRNFSLAHSYNLTGYGFLTISNITTSPSADYIHYITPSSTQTLIFDRVKINTFKNKIQWLSGHLYIF